MSKYLIVGGVAGGATTAARLRRIDEESEIIMFERGSYISYANCGLPYYIGDVIPERDSLFVQTPESFGGRFNVDVRIDTAVKSIDPKTKTVIAYNYKTDTTYTETYDKLILSPGAEAVRPPIPGIDSKGIFTLRNVRDTDKIKEFVNEQQPKRAVVVGAGFIGLEMAENLHHLGMQVTIVELLDQVMPPIDYSMAAIVHQHLKVKNVAFNLGDGVKSFEEQKDGSVLVHLNSGREMEVDMVILSIGVRADSKLAKEAGLEVGVTGGIKVNEYLQTSDSDIYAVGDAIEFPNPITNKPTVAYLAGPANRQGRVCADNIVLGNKTKYKGSIQTAIAKVFDITVGSTGVSAKTLKKEGIPFIESITHSGSHAGYYPGAIPLTIKIVFDPKTGKLFGAQAIGYIGVDKRLDLLATIVKQGGTIYDLIDIEHAYAPPYSSAKDPVNIAGYVAENILEGRMKPIQWEEVRKLDFEEFTLIDVREDDETELGTIPGAICIPLSRLRKNIKEIPKNKKAVVFCAVGLRGHVASRILMQNGFDTYNLSGGYKTYELSIMKQSNEDIYEDIEVVREHSIQQKATATKFVSKTVNTCGMLCPGPIIELKKNVDQLENGGSIEIQASDPGFHRDVQSWCNLTKNKLVDLKSENGIIKAIIEKSAKSDSSTAQIQGKNKTFIVFSDDLDKALASFVLANGAASTGEKVTMFFTFWGLNIIKKKDKPAVKKDIFGKMFSMMLPSSSKKLSLSKLNMFGIGSAMMRHIMNNKKIESLENLIKQAEEAGVEFIACQMSMDVMGVKREELVDNLTIGGVATYMERAEQANLNLFI